MLLVLQVIICRSRDFGTKVVQQAKTRETSKKMVKIKNGKSSYKRPPPLTTDVTSLYDSCVDNELNPPINIVCERDQWYPKYLIQYKLGRSLSYTSYLSAKPSTWSYYLSSPMCVSISTSAAHTASTKMSVLEMQRMQTCNLGTSYSSQRSHIVLQMLLILMTSSLLL